MKIMYVSSEIAPFIKSGGLGDVIGALPKEVRKQKHDVSCVMPLYKGIDIKYREVMQLVVETVIPLSWRKLQLKVYKLVENGVNYYFIENDNYFNRDNLYGYDDDAERFAFFSKATIELFYHLKQYPDIVHCNDWQTALIPVFLRMIYQKAPEYRHIKTVYTIHNLAYQGIFSENIIEDTFGIYGNDRNYLIYHNCTNLMKGAICCSDIITTVSNTYAHEIRTPYYGYGLDNILNEHANKIRGIVNGIDTITYNPKNDIYLTSHYSYSSYNEKLNNKRELQSMYNLPEVDVPLIAMVGRLSSIKGLDLVLEKMDDLLKLDCQFIVLGKGDDCYETYFKNLQHRYPSKVGVSIAFSDEIAHKFYGGSDIFLMPSQAEPCGLAQMIALRYGTIPVVRETGGLRDTVIPYNRFTRTGTGFSFANYNANEMLDAINRAIGTYKNKKEWMNLVKQAMKVDNSWARSASEYLNIYSNLTNL